MTLPVVVCDHQRRTAIAWDEKDGIIQFTPLNYENGFQVEALAVDQFRRLYPTEMLDYPVERAAVLYVQYAHQIGASREALDFLGQFVKLSTKDIEMATKTPSAKTGKPAAAAKKTVGKMPAVKAAKTPKAPGEPKAPRENASTMFRDLLVAQAKGENKLTDDQIFEKVQKQYGLDDGKRSYVSWYRGDAVRKGLISEKEAAALKASKAEAPAAKKAPAKAAPAAKKAPAKKAAKK